MISRKPKGVLWTEPTRREPLNRSDCIARYVNRGKHAKRLRHCRDRLARRDGEIKRDQPTHLSLVRERFPRSRIQGHAI